jgi:CheY-like chemotaxis protein
MIVDCAATTEEALERVARRSYDVLLCDLNLSAGGAVSSGEEAAARILSTAARKPAVIYMTGALVEAPEGAAIAGEPRRLQKPFRILDVLTLLQEILSAVPAETLRP